MSDEARKPFPVSWDQFHRDARALAWRLSGAGPFEAMVAVTRGGLVPAAVIARELGIRVIDTLCVSSYSHTSQVSEPTVLKGHNKMRVFQEEIFGPVVSVTTFKDEDEALSIANDTLYGLGAGVWSREANTCYRFGRAIEAGRVWVNNYHAYPAHAAFGGYKQSGIGRENHKMMLDHYQQTKNLLVSYNPNKLGFF